MPEDCAAHRKCDVTTVSLSGDAVSGRSPATMWAVAGNLICRCCGDAAAICSPGGVQVALPLQALQYSAESIVEN